MPDNQEVSRVIEVPAGSGAEGFLHTIREILKRPRVQSISINNRGQVTFSRVLLAGEPSMDEVQIDFKHLMPHAVIRNGQVQEVILPEKLSTALVMCHLFRAASFDQLNPIALVSGADTRFWEWQKVSTGVELLPDREEAYGLPFYHDRHIPDESLLMCTGYSRKAELVDTRKTYKVQIPGGLL